jgi:DNA-binding transcriptional LysR family regulator
MDMQDLRCFVAVARHGKIQAAADALFVCRQAVSKTLSQMEEELGTPLFIRSHNGIELNELGERFVDRAEALVRDFDSLESDMREAQEVCKVRICLPFTTNHHFWNILSGYLAGNATWLEVQAVNCLDAECHELLESGEVDMGVSFIKFRSGIDGGKLVASSPILIAVSERNPLARRDCMRPEDLVGNPLVYYMNGYESSFWLEKGGPKPSYSVNDILLAFDLVLNDKGVFPVPALSILDSMQGVAFVPFQGPNDRDDFYCSISEQAGRDARKRRACLALRDAMAGAGQAR